MKPTPARHEKLEDMRRVARLLETDCLSFPEYRDAGGKMSHGQIYADGEPWVGLCAELGIQAKVQNAPVDDAIYFERLKQFVETYKRVPKASEKENHIIKDSPEGRRTIAMCVSAWEASFSRSPGGASSSSRVLDLPRGMVIVM